MNQAVFHSFSIKELNPDSLTARYLRRLVHFSARPNFDKNKWIYVSYAAQSDQGTTTKVIRATLNDYQLLDIKTIPSFLITTFGRATIGNPALTLSQRTASENYILPAFNFIGSLQFKYLLKEPKRRRRK